MSGLTAASLSSSLSLTGAGSVQVTNHAATVVLLVVFSIQLVPARQECGVRPASSTFVVVVGAMIAMLLAVGWGLALALDEVALANEAAQAMAPPTTAADH